MNPPHGSACRCGNKTNKTAALTNTLNPKWQQSFTFPVKDASNTSVSFDVEASSGEILGQGTCNIAELLPAKGHEVTMTLKPVAGKSDDMGNRGTLKVQLEVAPNDQDWEKIESDEQHQQEPAAAASAGGMAVAGDGRDAVEDADKVCAARGEPVLCMNAGKADGDAS